MHFYGKQLRFFTGNAYSIENPSNSEPLPDFPPGLKDLNPNDLLLLAKADAYSAVLISETGRKKEQKKTRTEQLREDAKGQKKGAQKDSGKPAAGKDAVKAQPKEKRRAFWRYTPKDKSAQKNDAGDTCAVEAEQSTSATDDDREPPTFATLESRCAFVDCSDSEEETSQDCNVTKETVVEEDLHVATSPLGKKPAESGDKRKFDKSKKEDSKSDTQSPKSTSSRQSEKGSVMFKDSPVTPSKSKHGAEKSIELQKRAKPDGRILERPKSDTDFFSERYQQFLTIANQEKAKGSSPSRGKTALQRQQTLPPRRNPKLSRSPSKTLSLSSGSRSPRFDDVSSQSVNVEVAQKPTEHKQDDEVPISVSIILLAAYVFSGAWLFSYLEDWNDLTKGAYFTFITLSTIGFGDIVPGSTFFSGDFDQIRYISITLYVVFGLALISMCFNLMQAGVVNKARRLAKKLGIINEDD